MNWADWAIIAIISVSSLISLKRGFVREAFSLLTWVAAFIVARLFTAPLAALLASSIETPSVRLVVAFVLLFAATLILGALVANLLSALVKATGLSGTDRVLGMGFGLARGALVVVALLILAGMTPMPQDRWWQESRLIPHFALMESWTREVAAEVSAALLNAGAGPDSG